MTVSWQGGFARNQGATGGILMIVALLIAGSIAILAGLLTILYGFQLDLSFGNTLIMAGVFGLCSGIIVIAQAVVARELRKIRAHLGSLGAVAEARAALAGAATGGEEYVAAEASPAPGGLPWRSEATSRDRARPDSGMAPPPEVVDPPPLPKRRNLMFSSNVRKDRQGAAARPGEGAPSEPLPPPVPEVDSPPAGYDDAWPRPERARSSEVAGLRRSPRASSNMTENSAAARAPEWAAAATRSEEPLPPESAPAVTVIKSGVVDGMAYSLYSDGSIEAEMPEGMMRFASIDELRAHLDQRQ
jgi:hypothetical protein